MGTGQISLRVRSPYLSTGWSVRDHFLSSRSALTHLRNGSEGHTGYWQHNRKGSSNKFILFSFPAFFPKSVKIAQSIILKNLLPYELYKLFLTLIIYKSKMIPSCLFAYPFKVIKPFLTGLQHTINGKDSQSKVVAITFS